MRRPAYTRQFEKDIKKLLKSGKSKEKMKEVLTVLINGEELEPKYRDHKLTGKFKDRRECKIRFIGATYSDLKEPPIPKHWSRLFQLNGADFR